MSINQEEFQIIKKECASKNVMLVAVSKTKPAEDIQALYALGQRDFGENYVQELLEKQPVLPADIHWHFIGHLQSNKVKFIIPFVHLIHGVDSLKLLKEINKQALKQQRVVDCLLQVHIAMEETKFGFDSKELETLFSGQLEDVQTLTNIRICGLMGMASLTSEEKKVAEEYHFLKSLFDQYRSLSMPNTAFSVLSMGMSGDYKIAMEAGSSLIRVGSLIFGARVYP